MKLNTTNFLRWQSQITPFVRSLDVLHHLLNGEKHTEKIKDDEKIKSPNSQYQLWINNDRLLISWLLGIMKEGILSMIFGVETTYEVWTSFEKQLFSIIEEREKNLKNMLMTLKKRSLFFEEYLRDFKNICDNLVVVKKPISNQDKVFQLAHGLGQGMKFFYLLCLLNHLIISLTSLC